jgi:hypothetical protein
VPSAHFSSLAPFPQVEAELKARWEELHEAARAHATERAELAARQELELQELRARQAQEVRAEQEQEEDRAALLGREVELLQQEVPGPQDRKGSSVQARVLLQGEAKQAAYGPIVHVYTPYKLP